MLVTISVIEVFHSLKPVGRTPAIPCLPPFAVTIQFNKHPIRSVDKS